jgi:aminodeoxyfutalosine synthase
VITDVSELEAVVHSGRALTRAEAEWLLSAADLITIGSLGEAARKATTGDRVTYGRLATWPAEPGQRVEHAGELRIVARPESIEDALRLAREGTEGGRVSSEGGRVLVAGFSLDELRDLSGGDGPRLAAFSRQLAAAGLQAVAGVPLDAFTSIDDLAVAVRTIREAGLDVSRLTVTRASMDERLNLIERATAVQALVGGFKAFAPLPRVDSADAPSTGYDDVRTVAIARLMARDIPLVQVDWPLYGPKLAQVAIAYGANDIDAVSTIDDVALGPRRSSREDIERQIRAAGASPVERDGRFQARV